MNRFMIVVNPDKDTDSIVTNRIQSYLEAHGAACMVRDVFHLESSDWEALKKEQFDCVLVLGGDGTLCAWLVRRKISIYRYLALIWVR